MKAPHLRTMIVVTLAGLIATGCILGGRSQRVRRPGELDRKLDAFTYLEEGKLVAFAVGTEAARYRDKEKYVPFSIAIANKGAGTLTLSRESFTLQDENGKRYAAAPSSELNSSGYGPAELDRTFTGTFSVFLSRYSTYERLRSNFYPRPSGGLVIEKVEMPRYYHVFDWLYFPRPSDGVLGRRFELHMECPGLEEPIFVKFIVN